MIIVTGGAGFIGSAIVKELNSRGIDDILVIDRLGDGEKWRNLVGLRFIDFMDKELFISELETGKMDSMKIDGIFHLGACSSTTEKNADYLIENNFHYSVRIGRWWEKHPQTRFIYASSAATYGDGKNGYSDDESKIDQLFPLNMYGYSKHLFDLYALRKRWLEKIVGLKYFNVFGPNEYHKGDMRSVINKAFAGVRDKGTISLFKSHKEEYGDGDQLRDFIYVKDAVKMTLYFLENRHIGGIFNIGTGQARSWNDLAKAIFTAVNKNPVIDYIPMPIEIREKYQYFTQADLDKLRSSGCNHECMSLEDAVYDYVCNYLQFDKRLGEIRQVD
ncbi:MAG: ADP-glyceromanno-heptose 6-epimerase [Fibrobacter sp.]|nr:ADP-glyceromanno-heptose 6-epimerase [Fibrobacter sp.]